MKVNDKRLWIITKVLTYIGAILVGVCAVMIGMLKIQPPDILFSAAIAFVGVGVIVGNFVALRRIKRE